MTDDAASQAKATNNLAVATLAAAIIGIRRDASTAAVETATAEARNILLPRRTPAMYSRSTD